MYIIGFTLPQEFFYQVLRISRKGWRYYVVLRYSYWSVEVLACILDQHNITMLVRVWTIPAAASMQRPLRTHWTYFLVQSGSDVNAWWRCAVLYPNQIIWAASRWCSNVMHSWGWRISEELEMSPAKDTTFFNLQSLNVESIEDHVSGSVSS